MLTLLILRSSCTCMLASFTPSLVQLRVCMTTHCQHSSKQQSQRVTVIVYMYIPHHFGSGRRPSPGTYSMSQVRMLMPRSVGTDFCSYGSEVFPLLFEPMRWVA